MLTIMVLLRSNRKLPAFPRRADYRSVTIEGLQLRPYQYIKTRAEYPMNAFQLSEVKSLQRPSRDNRDAANGCSAPPRYRIS
jgi:hypothetical protein